MNKCAGCCLQRLREVLLHVHVLVHRLMVHRPVAVMAMFSTVQPKSAVKAFCGLYVITMTLPAAAGEYTTTKRNSVVPVTSSSPRSITVIEVNVAEASCMIVTSMSVVKAG